MYIVIFAGIAYIPNFFQDKEYPVITYEKPKDKVDSLLNIANKVEKKIDKKIMNKISNSNLKIDSLENVVRLQKIEIRKYKKLLRNGK